VAIINAKEPAKILIALPSKNEKHLGICPPFCMVEKDQKEFIKYNILLLYNFWSEKLSGFSK
jgi:hypothetical protein